MTVNYMQSNFTKDAERMQMTQRKGMVIYANYGWLALCCRRERKADASDLNKRLWEIIGKQRALTYLFVPS